MELRAITGSSPPTDSNRPDTNPERAEVLLTSAAARGDEGARHQLVARLLERVRRTVFYLAVPEKEVDDLSQLVLIEVLRSAGSFQGRSSLGYWADKITFHVVTDHLRKVTRRDHLMSDHLASLAMTSNLEEEISRKDLRARLAHHLQNLPPERRIALVLRHVQGYSISEIAEITKARVNTVRDRLRVGRKELRKCVVADPTFEEWATGRRR